MHELMNKLKSITCMFILLGIAHIPTTVSECLPSYTTSLDRMINEFQIEIQPIHKKVQIRQLFSRGGLMLRQHAIIRISPISTSVKKFVLKSLSFYVRSVSSVTVIVNGLSGHLWKDTVAVYDQRRHTQISLSYENKFNEEIKDVTISLEVSPKKKAKLSQLDVKFCTGKVGNDGEFPLIDEFIIEKYLGQWFQTYASKAVFETFTKDGTCVMAKYGVIDDKTISVFNSQNLFQPGHNVVYVKGTGTLTGEPGKLFVQFPNTGPPGDYWILKLGPRVHGKDGLYAYSLISEPNRRFVFVLARDLDDFHAYYEDGVLEFLNRNGFNNPGNELIATLHTSDCIYPSE